MRLNVIVPYHIYSKLAAVSSSMLPLSFHFPQWYVMLKPPEHKTTRESLNQRVNVDART